MEDAQGRRERLKALRAAAEEADSDEPAPAPASAKDEPVLKFRNYEVKDKKHIQHEAIDAAQPPDVEEPVADPADLVGEGDLLVNVAPKKANWDLRRDVEPKLAKLERRTQRALVTLMQQQQKHQLEVEGGQRD